MRTLVTAVLSLVLSMLSFAEGAAGQNQTLPVFDVSSVRHNTGSATISSARWFPGRFVAVNARLDRLITQAFGIPLNLAEQLVVGGIRRDARCNRNCSSRDEILSAHFDIQATFPGEVAPAQQTAVLRAFLQDRFKLQAQLVIDNSPVYELIVAREGRLGPKLRPSSHNCYVWSRARGEAIKRGDPVAPSPIGADGKPLCTTNLVARTAELVYVWKGAGEFSSLLNDMRGALPFILMDKTGLEGNYEWELTSLIPGIPVAANQQQNVPALEDALQEQLGLRLVRAKAPLEKLVILSVAMPTEN